MVVVLREDASAEERQAVGALLSDNGIAARAVRWVEHDLYIPEAALLPRPPADPCGAGRCRAVCRGRVAVCPRQPRAPPGEDTRARRHARLWRRDPVFIAGPCSVEGEAQILEAAEAAAGVGRAAVAWRRLQAAHLALQLPGTRPGGVRLLAAAGAAGLPVVTEVMEPALARWSPSTPTCSRWAAATCRTSRCCAPSAPARPVLLKRGFAATLDEWLLAAEYILAGGNAPCDALRARHSRLRSPHTQRARPRAACRCWRG